MSFEYFPFFVTHITLSGSLCREPHDANPLPGAFFGRYNMRKGIALLLASSLLATSAFAVGIKGPARPNKADDQVSELALAQQLEASLPRAASLPAPL